jgi:ATP-binding cassette subfamily B protein
MNKLIKHLKPYKWAIFATVIVLFIQAMCELNLPNLMSRMVNDGIQQGDTPLVFRTGLNMLLISLLAGTATITVGYASSRIAAGTARNLRSQIFAKVMQFSNTELDQFPISTLITRSTNDVMQIQNFLLIGIRMIIFAPVMAIGGIYMALTKAPTMGWIIALTCIVVTMLMIVGFTLLLPKFKILQKLIDKLNLVTREHLTGLMVIRAFGTQKHEKNRFHEINKEINDTNRFIGRGMSSIMPILMFCTNAILLLIIWVGADRIAQSTMQIGDMMAFMSYTMSIIMSFMFIAMAFMQIPRAMVAADRIDEVLTANPIITDSTSPQVPIESKRGVVEFKNVSFRYAGADENAISNITFTATPGQTTAIIGSTGSGKTTIVNLIMRYYDATDGIVEVSGIDVRNTTQSILRQEIGYVPQKSMLISGTIESNLTYGSIDKNESDIKVATEIAQATDFVESFDSEISQGGTNLSGGQRQRLSIARALVKKAPIYIFDDSFSALDFKTDANLRAALKENVASSTFIIIAQRVNTIQNADQIIVLDEGKIIGKGTHDELLKTCEEYREIAESQGVVA